jgi:lactate permease
VFWGLKKVWLNDLFAGTKIDTTLFGSKLGGTLSNPKWDMPDLHNLVQRMPPVVGPGAKPEGAQFNINWISTPGTGVFVAAILSGLTLGMSGAQWRQAVRQTARRMTIAIITGFVVGLTGAQWKQAIGQTLRRMVTPVLVIGQVLGLAALTRYSGTDAVLGLMFVGAGAVYPFFAAYLGWLGVFLTGSDTASNALFGSLQKITAQQLHLSPVLICATNSTGGVMGKMIDAQSIMVACAATYEDPHERAHAIGPIFRKVWWHSVCGAAFIGIIALIQSQFTGCIPQQPPPPPPKASRATLPEPPATPDRAPVTAEARIGLADTRAR